MFHHSYSLAFLPGREACHLHLACFYVCCGIAGTIFAILLYSLIKYRQSTGGKMVHFHAHPGLEIFWTIVPFLILTALAMPAMIVLKQACG